MPYRYLEEIATADAAFEAWGGTIEETFMAAADATVNVMVQDLSAIAGRETRLIRVESDSLEMLLFELLQELIYLKDAQRLLVRVSGIEVTSADGTWRLRATGTGETIDPEKHDLVVDVKAVTLHRFAVERTAAGWRATVILDI